MRLCSADDVCLTSSPKTARAAYGAWMMTGLLLGLLSGGHAAAGPAETAAGWRLQHVDDAQGIEA